MARTGSIKSVLQSQWSPIIVEVLCDGQVVGGVFLERQSESVFELDAVLEFTTMNSPKFSEVIFSVCEFVKHLGALANCYEISDKVDQKELLLFGFDVAFRDNVLILDI